MSPPAVVWRTSQGSTAVLAGTLTAAEAEAWLQVNASALWSALVAGTALAQTFDASGSCLPWQPGAPLPGAGGRLVVQVAPTR